MVVFLISAHSFEFELGKARATFSPLSQSC